jgi:two-component system, NarL family, invasion response regulator UvrY
MTRLLLLDDHALIRRGMRDALQDEGFEVCGEASSWAELQPLLSAGADVLLLDLNLPGISGLDILELLRERHDAPPAVVVSMYPEDQYGVRALRSGARAYVSKSADTARLVATVRAVASGSMPAAAAPAAAPHERLGEVEQALLVMLASGSSLADAAQKLGLAPKAAGVYRARIMEKLRLATNAELAHYALRNGLLPH